MEIISRLKELSTDFVLVTDPSGTTLSIGNHFRHVLEQQGFKEDELFMAMKHVLPTLAKSDTLAVSLEDLNLYPSTFSTIYRDDKEIVLLAKDLTLKQDSEHENHIRIKALMDESSDPIFGFKEDGTYFYVNSVFAHTLGYEKEDIIDKKIWDIFPEDEADKRYAVVQKTFLTGETSTIEVTIPLEDGNKHFLTTAKPFKTEREDSVEFVICISKDITELRTTQEQLFTLKGLLPICCKCKNIKNDQGSWQQLEEYLSNNTEAQFSHGLCPECAQALYPGYSLQK